MKKYIICMVLSALLVPCFARAEQDMAVSVAVVPFESFSGDQKTALGRDVAVKLLQQLSANPLIMTPDIESLKEVISKDDAGAPTEDRLREVAKQLKVNFLLFGSVTSVKDSTSIDAQVFYNFPGDNYFKTYAAGPDLDKVVEALAGKLEQELLDKAPGIPSAQRPKMKLRSQPLTAHPEAADYEKAVSRELAADQDDDEAESKKIKAAESTEPEDLVEDTALRSAAPKKVKKQSAQSDSKQSAQSDRKQESLPFKLEQPVNISADSMEYSNKDNGAIFRGNVVARQGDIVMFAEQMEATYAGKAGEKNEKGGIKELVATGNVKIIQGERIATGQRIVFYGDEQKIVATGNPRVWQGDNVIVGTKITVYLKQDRSVVEGSTQDRVSATIYPKEKKSIKK
jgi:lipopolysaccharide export system protein LptA